MGIQNTTAKNSEFGITLRTRLHGYGWIYFVVGNAQDDRAGNILDRGAEILGLFTAVRPNVGDDHARLQASF